MPDDIVVRVRLQRETEREVAARAVDTAIWLALVQAERAGWTDVAQALLELKDVSGARRREIEGI